MAFTVAKNTDGDVSLGNLRAELVTLTPAASDYAPGGYAITAAGIGMNKILGVLPVGDTGGDGYILKWNAATGKLQVFAVQVTTAGSTIYAPVELAVSTDLSSYTFQLLVIGL